MVILIKLLDKPLENLCLPRILVSWETFDGISPENSFEEKSMVWSLCGNIHCNWFSLKAKVLRVFCIEIQFGISPTRPQDFKDNLDNINFGSIVALLF